MGSGIVAVRQGAHGWARALFEEALAFARTSGNKRWIASALTNLGWLALRQGDYEQVRALYAESLPLLWTVGDKVLITAALLDLAIVAAAQDQPERAARLLGALEAQAAATGEHFWPDERAEFDRAVAATCTQLDEATFAAAWAAGRALTFEQAIAEALAGTAAAEAQGKHP